MCLLLVLSNLGLAKVIGFQRQELFDLLGGTDKSDDCFRGEDVDRTDNDSRSENEYSKVVYLPLGGLVEAGHFNFFNLILLECERRVDKNTCKYSCKNKVDDGQHGPQFRVARLRFEKFDSRVDAEQQRWYKGDNLVHNPFKGLVLFTH